MAMRLQEVHPSLVHFPIALPPVTLGADVVGKVTGSRTLLKIGKYGMALTAGTAAVAGLAGLIAQEEVRAEGRAYDLLVTHRTLNVGFLALATTMAVRRFMRKRPSARYLAAGIAGLGTLAYSAYLGGHMVYEYGVGVRAAGGILEGHAPELVKDRAGEIARHAASDLKQATRHVAEDLSQGQIVPAMRTESQEPPEARA